MSFHLTDPNAFFFDTHKIFMIENTWHLYTLIKWCTKNNHLTYA
jgi:hypothetical protein